MKAAENETSSPYFLIEQEILGINQEKVDQIFNKILESNIALDFVTGFIEYALQIRPNQTEALNSLQRKILIKRGINKEKSDNSEKVKLFEEGSVAEAIKEDSVDKLVKITAQQNFNPKGTLRFGGDQLLYFIPKDTDKDRGHIEDIKVTYMQLMAYFGSVKCFKYALIDGSFDDNGISEYAIAGGNLEIIHLLEQKGESFDGCFDISVKFHRYEISEWLFRNYECNISLNKVCKYYNDRMFFFCVQNNIDITNDSINQCFVSSAKTGNMFLFKYVIEHYHPNIEVKDEKGWTALNGASGEGHIEVVKYLIEHCHADLETKNKDRLAPLNSASFYGHLEVVKYLVEHCHADVETEDECGWTPLNNASRYGHFEVVKYLIDHCHADVEKNIYERWSPLNWASCGNYFDIVKYLVEHGCKVAEKDVRYGNLEIIKYLQKHVSKF